MPNVNVYGMASEYNLLYEIELKLTEELYNSWRRCDRAFKYICYDFLIRYTITSILTLQTSIVLREDNESVRLIFF